MLKLFLEILNFLKRPCLRGRQKNYCKAIVRLFKLEGPFSFVLWDALLVYITLPSSGQTLALADPEARLYNQQPDRPPSPEANVSIGYNSAISQWIELKFCMIVIQVVMMKSADKTQTLQHCSNPCSACRISISQKLGHFLSD